MTKKDIAKILTIGSTKERLLLIAEERARGKFHQKKLLTDSDFNQLSNSFKEPNEIKIWNEFLTLDETITNAIMNLQGLKFEVLMNYSNLRGYILVWNSIEKTELLVNSVLHEIKDPQERKQIAKNGAKGIRLMFSKTELDQEGFIELKVDFKGDSFKADKKKKLKNQTLGHAINNVKKEVDTSIIKYLSWERATLDFMDERGFNIKTYKEHIKQMTAQIYNPIVPLIGEWAKFCGGTNLWEPNSRLENIMKKYVICPKIYELKVDESQYNWFRRYFLDGDDYTNKLKSKVNKNLIL